LPDPPLLGRGRLRHEVIDLGNGFDDYYSPLYPQASSQWDALSHFQHPELGYYGGFTAEQVRDPRDPALGIDRWARSGIVGRFVLADVARYLAGRGRPVDCAKRVAVDTEDIEATLAAQGSTLAEGDILLLHFGWTSWYEALPPAGRQALAGYDLFFPGPGLAQGREMARWLTEARLAAVAADVIAVEATPFDPHSADCLHATLIPVLGMAVGELFDLAALADDCAADGRYQGLLVAAPLNVAGGAGSPANAIAIK
jgi:kynurenine formamidase